MTVVIPGQNEGDSTCDTIDLTPGCAALRALRTSARSDGGDDNTMLVEDNIVGCAQVIYELVKQCSAKSLR